MHCSNLKTLFTTLHPTPTQPLKSETNLSTYVCSNCCFISQDSDCDGDLECLNGNDDSCGLSSEVLIDPICSPQYFVYVTGFGSASGSFTLDAACTAAPAEIF